MKKIFALIFLTYISLSSFAQKGSISGILLDSTNHQNSLNYATVSVYKQGDSVLSTYKLSDTKGTFKITGLELGTSYRVVVNAWLYEVYRKEFILTASQTDVDFGKLYLSPQSSILGVVEIVAERPPIIVRKDTIEFNAESFKTLPTAVVEDLLKKLPGVNVGTDGSILVNGRSVSKILVDGKDFFGGEQQMATKNLPANIIDKIQVTDDKEAKRRDPDLVEANTPQVINLKLKKVIKSGAFGKLYGGGGNKELYEAGGIMNLFRDTTQVSFLAYGNNVNKAGFAMNDVMRIGGFARSGTSSMSMSSDGGFELDGISFGGPMGGGVQTSVGAGANFNTLTKKGIKLNGKYFFTHQDNWLKQVVDEEQTLGTGFLFSNKLSNNQKINDMHNMGAKIEFPLDSNSQLTIEPTLRLGFSRGRENQETFTSGASNQRINDGLRQMNNSVENTAISVATHYWRDFIKAGRVLNASLNYSYTDNLNDAYNINLANFYNPVLLSQTDQLRNNILNNNRLSLNLSYSEPISKALSLSFFTLGAAFNNENALHTFAKNPDNDSYTIAIPSLTETVRQSGVRTNSRVSLRWKVTKDLTLSPGLVFNTIHLENSFNNYPDFDQKFNFFAPQMTLRYKDLSFNYSPGFSEPSVSYIQPVVNNTNLLYIQNGNPNLRPSKTHSINANIYKYNTKSSLSYNGYLGGSVQNDGIVLSRTINTDGVQEVTPVNEDGIWQFHANGNITKDFKTGKNIISLNSGFWGNYNSGVVLLNAMRSSTKNLTFGPRLGSRFNFNDVVEWVGSYSLTYNRSTYSDTYFSDLKNLGHDVQTELIVRFPKKVVWESNYSLSYADQGRVFDANKIEVWSAGVTMLFMKNDRLQLKFSMNDILNAGERRLISIRENYISNTSVNNLGRYGMLSLTYNIQNFGGKVGGMSRWFGF